ncbi:hypothetical protein ACFXA3_35840, partial [Streptomyces sp. NPDC059456]|uniref:hypothetical protein n=1 Tax=Streptomyces sp. NPDC059456 TaxID=3346838 RepID=UPI003691F860
MGRRSTQASTGGHSAHDTEAVRPGPCAHDVHWAGERRAAVAVALLLFTALCTVDAGSGRLDVMRGVLWTGLAGLLFVVLLPHRVCVRPGLLSARGLLTTHTVRTDSLVSVRWSDGVDQRVILRDTEEGGGGGRGAPPPRRHPPPPRPPPPPPPPP